MELRAMAEEALPEGAFLRRDRGEALYVTNAPAKGWNGSVAGFEVRISGQLAFLTPDADTMQSCGYGPDRLASEISRLRGASPEALRLFAACMKCVEAPETGLFEKCDRAVRQAAAAALRCGGGEGLYYCALALAEARRRLNDTGTEV